MRNGTAHSIPSKDLVKEINALKAQLKRVSDAMANDAGLHLVERWSDWRRSPFTADDNVHVSLYAATA